MEQQYNFDQLLDDRPDDFTLRLIYADYLAEHGCPVAAYGQRWQAENKIWPLRLENSRWLWCRKHPNNHNLPEYCVPAVIFSRLEKINWSYATYATRKEAELDLSKALWQHNLAQRKKETDHEHRE